MSGFMKGVIFMLTVLYVISPIDACPGPIDDILVIMFSMAARKKLDAASE